VKLAHLHAGTVLIRPIADRLLHAPRVCASTTHYGSSERAMQCVPRSWRGRTGSV
jgi:hypothetical protein